MPAQQLTTKAYLTSLSVIYGALLMGQVFFCLIAYLLNRNGQFGNDVAMNQALEYVVPVLTIGLITASSLIERNRLPAIRQKSSLQEKLNDYRALIILKLALHEGSCLFALVSYLLTANPWFLGLAAFLIVIFIFNRPSIAGITTSLHLNHNERSVLEDPSAVIGKIEIS